MRPEFSGFEILRPMVAIDALDNSVDKMYNGFVAVLFVVRLVISAYLKFEDS